MHGKGKLYLVSFVVQKSLAEISSKISTCGEHGSIIIISLKYVKWYKDYHNRENGIFTINVFYGTFCNFCIWTLQLNNFWWQGDMRMKSKIIAVYLCIMEDIPTREDNNNEGRIIWDFLKTRLNGFNWRPAHLLLLHFSKLALFWRYEVDKELIVRWKTLQHFI